MAMESIRASAAASMSDRASAQAPARPASVAQGGGAGGATVAATPRVPRVTLHAPPKPVVAAPDPAFDPGEMRQRLEEVAQLLNEQLRSTNTNLAFGVDPVADRTVITVTDRGGDVVREIPGEVFLRVARNIERFIQEGADSHSFKGLELDRFL